MTPEKVIELAKQARLKDWWDSGNENYETFIEHLQAFAQLVATLVRNETLEEVADMTAACDRRATPQGIACAIRSLKS